MTKLIIKTRKYILHIGVNILYKLRQLRSCYKFRQVSQYKIRASVIPSYDRYYRLGATFTMKWGSYYRLGKIYYKLGQALETRTDMIHWGITTWRQNDFAENR